jgi:hypothetical protein
VSHVRRDKAPLPRFERCPPPSVGVWLFKTFRHLINTSIILE